MGRGSRKVAQSNAVQVLPNNTRDWWEQALTTYRAEFLGNLREILETTTETQDGCLEVPTKPPKRVT